MKTDLSLLEAMDVALEIIDKQDAVEYLTEVSKKSDDTIACFLKDLECNPSDALGRRRTISRVWTMAFSEFELSYDKSISTSVVVGDKLAALEFSQELVMEGMLGSMSSSYDRRIAA